MKVAVQCKQYTSRAVGNDAVQQIHTAKTIYGADHAVVVCSKPLFTKSAQEAAKACGVLLITENQLPNLSRLLRERQHQ
jgi:HJR/Mrr/RecB family endonuclease